MGSTETAQAHPSWSKIGPNTYSQSYGFQEVLYNAISVDPGSPGLFLVALAATLSYTPPNDDQAASEHDLVPLIRNAWLQVRQQYPTVAAEPLSTGKVYTSPSSPAELAAWLNETFITVPGKTWADLYRTMVKTSRMTMYYLPEASQIFLQGEHHTVDGRGAIALLDSFFRALASPAGMEDLWRADGTEVSLLPPRSEDLLDIAESSPGRGEQRAIELLTPFNTMSSPISIPKFPPFLPCSPFNSTASLKASTSSTASITAACRSHRISVTAAWHAAAVLATKAIQAEHVSSSGVEATQFACFGNFDLRRYFGKISVPAHTVSNHHCILPYVLSTEKKTFLNMARELDVFYRQDLPKADPDVWSALGPMVRMLVPGFSQGELQDTTPALSSLGVVDMLISRDYGGGWAVEDVWFGNTVTGPWLECFMWTWKGRLVLNACYNEAFYTQAEVDSFHEKVLGIMTQGVAVSEAKL